MFNTKYITPAYYTRIDKSQDSHGTYHTRSPFINEANTSSISGISEPLYPYSQV
jgi:hypothetical protein